MTFSQFQIPSSQMMTVCIKFTKASQKTVRNLNHWATFPALLRKSRTIYIPYFFQSHLLKVYCWGTSVMPAQTAFL